MCGICGVHDPTGRAVDRDTVRAMAATIEHRGPDDEGLHLGPGIGLGFRRLAIIDLDGGHQPMTDPAGEVHVVFNGEIYNFRALRADLERRGHVFRTRCDTEVVLHGYREWGDGVLERLNGMFGLGIWDARRDRLLLARDRAGIKPLYWAVEDGRLLFGSEIRAVVAGLRRRPTLDPAALALFLRYRYTPAPSTLHAEVHKLAPGTLLVSDASGVDVRTWWSFRPEPLDPEPTVADALEALDERYRAAVEAQLVSDVPLGVLLSGGLDSGLLLALMNGAGGRGWPAFTVGFGDEHPGDEIDAAAATARALGAEHVVVRLDRRDFDAALPRVVHALEEPVASPSIVPMWFVCERARQDVKVVLVGQGPDELLGGYRRHVGVRYGHWYRALPAPARRAAAGLVAALPRNATAKRAVASLDAPDRFRRWEQVLGIEPAPLVDGLFRAGALPPDAGLLDAAWRPIEALASGADELGAFQYLETRSTLPDELLLYGDKLSMAHGLEARVPFLDHDVIEYVLRLPPRFKVRAGQRKWIHRELCRRHLPPEVLRRPKRGFAVDVVDDWYRGSVGGILDDTLSEPDARIYDLLDPDAVRRLVAEHRSGRQDRHKLLHSLVVTELWLRDVAVV